MKSYFTLVLMVFLVLVPGHSQGASYDDVPSIHWAYDNIESLSQRGIFGGYVDGTFKPDKYVSLLEVFSIIQRMSNASAQDLARAQSMYGKFLEGLEVSPWARPGLSYALYKNIVYESELMKANREGRLTDVPIKDSDFPGREEIAVYFGRFLEVAPDFDHSNLAYGDISEIGRALANDLEVTDYLSPLVAGGVLSSRGSDGRFEPTRPFRRSELASIVVASFRYMEEAKYNQ